MMMIWTIINSTRHNTPEVLSDRGCSKTNEYEGLWNYPKRPARLLAKSPDIAPHIVDQNRYASLRDSQWLTTDNDPDFDLPKLFYKRIIILLACAQIYCSISVWVSNSKSHRSSLLDLKLSILKYSMIITGANPMC